MDYNLSIDVKRAALKICQSVVSIVSRTGGKFFSACSGTILSCEGGGDDTYVTTILTSATLLRSSTFSCEELNDIPEDFEVRVTLSDGRCFEATVAGYDFHYNIALVNIQSDATFPSAKVRLLEDFFSADRNARVRSGSFQQLAPHSERFKIFLGDTVAALGRHFRDSHIIIVLEAKLCCDRVDLDCVDLLTADREISRCGIGGPVVNLYGEVIGVSFHDQGSTPFLPINIVSKCLEHFRKYGKFCRPSLGMDVHSLHGATMHDLDKIIRNFPNTFKGVFVENVRKKSSTGRAGIREGDVIIQCDGTPVQSLFEFVEMVFDKIGESVELVVLRASSGTRLNLTLVFDEISPDKFNKWPLPPVQQLGTLRHTMKRRFLHCCRIISEGE